MKMGQKIELSTAGPSLLILNEYCLLDVFEFLDLDDFITLARSCRRLKYVANRVSKKYSHFEFNSRMVEKGDEYIDRITTHIGRHVSSLRIYCEGKPVNFGKIISDWKNIKSLRVDNYRTHGMLSQNIAHLYCFDNVEMLSIYYCYLGEGKSFLNNFHNLKCFNILQYSDIETNQLKTIFENNPDIESFIYWVRFGDKFDFELLEKIPKVKKLCLSFMKIENLSNLNCLLKLNQLTKLRLNCRNTNINNTLSGLARKGILEEMVLVRVETNEHFFSILKLFDKLELLVIDNTYFDSSYFGCSYFGSSIVWPANLKYLRLFHFKLTYDSFLLTIKQLKNLQSINVGCCDCVDESRFIDLITLSKEVLNIIGCNDKGQRLDVILPHMSSLKEDISKKCLFNSQQLRLFYYGRHAGNYNPVGINMRFPVCDDFYKYSME